MMPSERIRAGAVWLWLALAYASLAIFKKVGAVPALIWIVLDTGGCGWLWWRVGGGLAARFLAGKRSVIALVALLGVLLVAFLTIHPSIDTEGFRVAGKQIGASDADDALEVAASELREGRYPYTARTFLDNPITPLPGAMLLALPFSWFDLSGLQTIFWLGLFCVLLSRWIADGSFPVWVMGALFGLCPTVLYQLLQGTDYLGNGIYVLIASWGLARSVRADARRAWIGWSVLLGLGLSSRLNFMVTTPVLFGCLWQIAGWRRAVMSVLPAALTFALVTLPFYLWDPEGFSPLHTAGKLDPDGARPWFPWLVAAVAVAVSFGLGFRKGSERDEVWIARVFFVQAGLLMVNCAVGWLSSGGFPWSFAHFGTLVLPFALAAFSPPLWAATQTCALPRAERGG